MSDTEIAIACAAALVAAVVAGFAMPPTSCRQLVPLFCGCGLLGGLANYAMAFADNQRSIARSLVCGVVATLMVPMAMNVAGVDLVGKAIGGLPLREAGSRVTTSAPPSSDAMATAASTPAPPLSTRDELPGQGPDPSADSKWFVSLLVLVGFCLAASVFSPTFLQQMQGVFQRVSVQQQTIQAELDQKRLAQVLQVQQTRALAATQIASTSQQGTLSRLTPSDAVLWAADLNRTAPTTSAISLYLSTDKDPALTPAAVGDLTTKLSAAGLLVGRSDPQGSDPVWTLTDAGREQLRQAAAKAATEAAADATKAAGKPD